MKYNVTKRILSALLSFGMLVSSASYIFAADNYAPEQKSNAVSTTAVVETADKDQDLIDLANGLANGTHTAYSSAYRDQLNIKNQTMSLDYNLVAGTNMNVSSFENTKGTSYLNNTMDIFIKTDDGEKYSSTSSTKSATMNVYRYGYYYYENRIEGQVFIPEIRATASKQITSSPRDKNDISNVSSQSGKYSYTISGSDPYIGFGSSSSWTSLGISTSDYNYLELTLKTGKPNGASQVFIIAGSGTSYTSTQSISFSLATDGEYHTYYVPISMIADYTGTLKAIRLDINAEDGSKVEIDSIKLIKAQETKIDSSLSIQRSFLTYSDKLHHLTQFSTLKEIDGIESVGMETKIAANTVNALVVKDAGGLKYSLEEVDWASAEYVGFDIAGAGIFGYILPADNKSGSLEVTNDGTNYIITQTMAVDKFTPSCTYHPELDAQKGRYEVIAPENGNDIFFGQRIYNDETHDFSTFIYEAECERNPLTADNIIVDFSEEGSAFVGYDALRGYYRFSVNGTSFGPAYYDHPNRHFNVRFTVKGDEYNRQMYFMTRCSRSGCLETSVLLNDRDMLLPIPMEVAKNFGSDGENTIYNNQDKQYGETYFPIIANAGETRTYNVINLYQNWGQFPLKQISSIQFHQPYYHLSTGATETNCIVPYPVGGPGLPDHRAMSAPFWTGQPQHNSGGGHSFLGYTNANGKHSSSQDTTASIDSYGPTYCDITLDYVTYDGKITAEYTHTELPQIDENRAFYEMKYTFLEDVSINDFRNDFTFYGVTDNNATGVYQKVGYLDVNNESRVVDAEHSSTVKGYILGKECPYFSFFMMPEWNRESTSAQGYTNLSMLFKDWKVVINGEEIVPNLYIRNYNERIYLSMDLGQVDFKAGDTITINAILMPWGSQQMEDDPANRLENAQTAIYESPHYSDVLPDGSLYMDKNVRDVRENTLLDPITTTAHENATVIDTPFIPKVKTTNGKNATFTISGAYDNNVVRVYGFNKLTVPKIEELVNGEWVEYKVSSATTPDQMGYSHSYDGYMVHYDEDGTYSYSFVYNMTDYASRTFRVTAEEDFEGWSYSADNVKETFLDVVITGKELYSSASKATENFFPQKELSDDDSYVRLYINPAAAEAYSLAYTGGTQFTGKYIVYKYRIPTTNSKNTAVEFWTSTQTTNAGGKDNISIANTAVRNDGEWHVMVVDVTQLKHDNCTFAQNEYGAYVPRYLRIDITNGNMAEGDYVDFAYIGFSDSIAEIVAANQDVNTIDIINSTKNSYTSISTNNYSPSESDALKVGFGNTELNINLDTVTMDLKIENNKGFNFLRVIPQFDSQLFELVSIENGDLISQMSQLNGSIIWNGNDLIAQDGSIARFTFKVKGNVSVGDYSFGIKVVSAYSTASSEVITITEAGILTVWDGNYGDCNGDEMVNLYDITLLREYLVSYDGDPAVSIKKEADANADGEINSFDLHLIRKYLANYNYDTNTPGFELGKQD